MFSKPTAMRPRLNPVTFVSVGGRIRRRPCLGRSLHSRFNFDPFCTYTPMDLNIVLFILDNHLNLAF